MKEILIQMLISTSSWLGGAIETPPPFVVDWFTQESMNILKSTYLTIGEYTLKKIQENNYYEVIGEINRIYEITNRGTIADGGFSYWKEIGRPMNIEFVIKDNIKEWIRIFMIENNIELKDFEVMNTRVNEILIKDLINENFAKYLHEEMFVKIIKKTIGDVLNQGFKIDPETFKVKFYVDEKLLQKELIIRELKEFEENKIYRWMKLYRDHRHIIDMKELYIKIFEIIKGSVPEDIYYEDYKRIKEIQGIKMEDLKEYKEYFNLERIKNILIEELEREEARYKGRT